jgi:prepilin-type N-terminal cleavage/methylation domain-containing protein
MKKLEARMGSKKGFTLIELLVVIAIIGILAALLFPAVNGAMIRAKAVKVGSDGKQIQMGLFSENVQRVERSAPEIWPEDGLYGTSTDFFRTCIESNYLENFTIRDFGGPGLPAPADTNASDFQSENNAWCITVGLGEGSPADTPLLFTRNFTGGSTLDSISTMDPAEKLFKDKVGVVITFGGSVKIINGRDMRQNAQRVFNPGASQAKFIRPE